MHRLALALGRTLSEIEGMGYREFLSWQAYYSLEPFGSGRDNFHAGVIASTIANCHSKRQFKPSDFMIKDEEQRANERKAAFLSGLRKFATKKKEG